MDIKNLEKRFWPKVKKENGCWKWLAAKNYGYGQLGIKRSGPCIGAHRLSWILHYGEIPHDMCVLHKCDNRECTNPEHLFLGTQRDNVLDMMMKGRGKQYGAKLNKDQVARIKALRAIGLTQRTIGILFGVHQSTVSDICLGKFRFYR